MERSNIKDIKIAAFKSLTIQNSPGLCQTDKLAIFLLLSFFWHGQIRPVLIMAEYKAPSALTMLWC